MYNCVQTCIILSSSLSSLCLGQQGGCAPACGLCALCVPCPALCAVTACALGSVCALHPCPLGAWCVSGTACSCALYTLHASLCIPPATNWLCMGIVILRYFPSINFRRRKRSLFHRLLISVLFSL